MEASGYRETSVVVGGGGCGCREYGHFERGEVSMTDGNNQNGDTTAYDMDGYYYTQ